jgi:hypothetical protein
MPIFCLLLSDDHLCRTTNQRPLCISLTYEVFLSAVSNDTDQTYISEQYVWH